jgi:hypothetical protein
MMTDGHRVTAVLDFGFGCIAGDARINLFAAAVNLEDSHTHAAIPANVDMALMRLRSRGLIDYLDAARASLAAYWTYDPDLSSWCQSVLDSRSVVRTR